jgi:ATP-binding cassette, subfamily B, bacterial
MEKFKFFKQLESIDCGATCLKMVSHFYGKEIDIKYLREITYTNKNGINLNSLITAANKLNIDTLPVKLTFEELIVDAPLPAILHWKNTHYIVVEKIEKKREHLFSSKKETIVTIADPGFGKLKLSKKEFENLWHIDNEGKGVALLLEPNENFDKEKILIEATNHVKFFTENILPFKGKIFKASLLIFIIACLNFIYPYLNQRLIDEGVSNRNTYFVILIFELYT